MKKIATATATVGVLAVVALSGCGTTGSAVSGPAATSVKPAASAAAQDGVLKFGQAYKYDDGLIIKLGVPSAYKPGQYAAGNDQAHAVKIPFTLINGTTKPFDATIFSTSGTSGDKAISEIFDSEKNITGAPSVTVRPGKTLTWTGAYSVANPKDINIDVDPDFGDHDTISYSN